ncbi:MAG: nucleotidyl transferase AbiEii/AbiGii toxin family protein [Epsilonproteobacteria bacterium]|nr:MAG: nucleotidyl transferase AbiEii/AbiGii toxin family protein [Campylobacterota bacterium]
MNKIALGSAQNRKDMFNETANLMNTVPSIIEKDFWVVWLLEKIFLDNRLNKILMFKGGTSLSKVFDLIGRFSEDIDLILDWNLVAKQNPQDPRGANRQDKYNKKVNKTAKVYIENTLLPIVSELVEPICSCKIDEDNPYNINVSYPVSFHDDYLRPEILLEIGPLAAWLPFNSFEISSYAAQKFPRAFTKVECRVNAIVAKRTFWEKATILQNTALRPESKVLPPRYSRHYYDLALMSLSPVKNESLEDLILLEQVAEFKTKFYIDKWSDYSSAKAGSLKLVPANFRIAELKKDYKAMRYMIFDKYLEFEEILKILQSLEDEVNSLEKTDD